MEVRIHRSNRSRFLFLGVGLFALFGRQHDLHVARFPGLHLDGKRLLAEILLPDGQFIFAGRDVLKPKCAVAPVNW